VEAAQIRLNDHRRETAAALEQQRTQMSTVAAVAQAAALNATVADKDKVVQRLEAILRAAEESHAPALITTAAEDKVSTAARFQLQAQAAALDAAAVVNHELVQRLDAVLHDAAAKAQAAALATAVAAATAAEEKATTVARLQQERAAALDAAAVVNRELAQRLEAALHAAAAKAQAATLAAAAAAEEKVTTVARLQQERAAALEAAVVDNEKVLHRLKVAMCAFVEKDKAATLEATAAETAAALSTAAAERAAAQEEFDATLAGALQAATDNEATALRKQRADLSQQLAESQTAALNAAPVPNMKPKCTICLDENNAADTACIPCGHTFCEVCIDGLRNNSGDRQTRSTEQHAIGFKCSICRKLVESTLKMYLAFHQSQ